jgi:hypothetical protein
VASEAFRFARAAGRAEDRSTHQLLDLPAQTFHPGSARGWIQNYDRVFHGESGFRLFFKLRRRNLPACKK